MPVPGVSAMAELLPVNVGESDEEYSQHAQRQQYGQTDACYPSACHQRNAAQASQGRNRRSAQDIVDAEEQYPDVTDGARYHNYIGQRGKKGHKECYCPE